MRSIRFVQRTVHTQWLSLSLHLFIVVGRIPVTVPSCWFISNSVCVDIPRHVAKHRWNITFYLLLIKSDTQALQYCHCVYHSLQLQYLHSVLQKPKKRSVFLQKQFSNSWQTFNSLYFVSCNLAPCHANRFDTTVMHSSAALNNLPFPNSVHRSGGWSWSRILHARYGKVYDYVGKQV